MQESTELNTQHFHEIVQELEKADKEKTENGDFNQATKTYREYFAEALTKVFQKESSSLTSINLNKAYICDSGAEALAKALEGNTKVTSINLKWTGINDAGAQALAEALKKNTSVTSIDLSYNEIGDSGAQALAEALEKNTSLQSINLGLNKISNGAQALAAALKKNTSLQSIDLSCNSINDDGINKLVTALNTKKDVKLTIDLSNNQIGSDGLKSLKGNEKIIIRSLDFTNVKIDKGTFASLAEFLKENARITSINLSIKKAIGEVGSEIQALADALKESKTLKQIHIDFPTKDNKTVELLVSTIFAANSSLDVIRVNAEIVRRGEVENWKSKRKPYQSSLTAPSSFFTGLPTSQSTAPANKKEKEAEASPRMSG